MKNNPNAQEKPYKKRVSLKLLNHLLKELQETLLEKQEAGFINIKDKIKEIIFMNVKRTNDLIKSTTRKKILPDEKMRTKIIGRLENTYAKAFVVRDYEKKIGKDLFTDEMQSLKEYMLLLNQNIEGNKEIRDIIKKGTSFLTNEELEVYEDIKCMKEIIGKIIAIAETQEKNTNP